jgi:hypothetical protein
LAKQTTVQIGETNTVHQIIPYRRLYFPTQEAIKFLDDFLSTIPEGKSLSLSEAALNAKTNRQHLRRFLELWFFVIKANKKFEITKEEATSKIWVRRR